jgi:hypothetical protein
MSTQAALYEIGAEVGDTIAVSYWKIVEDVLCFLMGYVNKRFIEVASERNPDNFLPSRIGSRRTRVVKDFLSRAFTNEVAPGDEHHYKISVAMAQTILDTGPLGNTEIIDGLIYPSVAMKLNSDNIALKPTVADSKLMLSDLRFIKFINRTDQKFVTEQTDSPRNSINDGNIVWYGGVPAWTSKDRDRTYTFIAEELNDSIEWVCYDEEGNTVEPELTTEILEFPSSQSTDKS